MKNVRLGPPFRQASQQSPYSCLVPSSIAHDGGTTGHQRFISRVAVLQRSYGYRIWMDDLHDVLEDVRVLLLATSCSIGLI